MRIVVAGCEDVERELQKANLGKRKLQYNLVLLGFLFRELKEMMNISGGFLQYVQCWLFVY